MEYSRIEDIPSPLIRQRIQEGWDMYCQICRATSRSLSGGPSNPNTWASFPQISQLFPTMRQGYDILRS